jgi:RimJ/RimL family protein N-acetyltransferase
VVVRNADGRAVGHVSWHEVHYGPNPESSAWNIGISLVHEARGRGLGAEAQRLLAQHLFATTPFRRVEAVTDVENLAEQGALARAGFTREGVLRGAQYRAGGWHDVVVWSVIRGEV